jgi:hypothetical protein
MLVILGLIKNRLFQVDLAGVGAAWVLYFYLCIFKIDNLTRHHGALQPGGC